MTITMTPVTWLSPRWWSLSNSPMALADAPRATNTTEKPATNSSVERNTRRCSTPRASASSSPESPDMSDRYPGTNGSTQGERNDSSPAPNAAGMLGSATCTYSPVKLGVRFSANAARPSWRSLLVQRACHRGDDLVIGQRRLEPIERQLVGGDGQRSQGGDLGRPGLCVGECADAVDEAQVETALPVDLLRRQQHRPRLAPAHQQRRQLHGSVVDRQAELGRGNPETRRRSGDAEIAGDGQLHASAEREPVDRGQGDNGRGPQRLDAALDAGAHAFGVLAAEISAGAEMPTGTGDHDRPGVTRDRCVHRVGDGVARREVDRVAPGLPIDRDGDDAIDSCSHDVAHEH